MWRADQSDIRIRLVQTLDTPRLLHPFPTRSLDQDPTRPLPSMRHGMQSYPMTVPPIVVVPLRIRVPGRLSPPVELVDRLFSPGYVLVLPAVIGGVVVVV